MPKVSVILPIYNAAATLPQTLRSLCRQRFDDFEIIAINDGSEDTTPDILDQQAQKDARIRVIHTQHKGLIEALNLGIKHTRSPYIARCDADDVMHPDRLHLQYHFLQSHLDIAVVSSRIRCFPRPQIATGFRIYEHWLNSLHTSQDIAREIFVESPIVHPSILARKSAIVTVGGYCEWGWAEDYDLWLRLHLADFKFSKLPQTLHFWRESSNRLTRQDGRYSTQNFLKAKAHYLKKGHFANDPRTIIWGSGQMGRRLSKHLIEQNIEILAFVDIDPKKIGNTRQGAPIIAPEALLTTWQDCQKPLILAAVPARGARQLIRQRLRSFNMKETLDFICVA